MNRRRWIAVFLIIWSILAIFIGPLDGFRHGHYYEEFNNNLISEEDWHDNLSLKDDHEVDFMPMRKYLNGISVIFDQPQDNSGTLVLSILNSDGTPIEDIPVDLSKPNSGTWYKIDIRPVLKKGVVYKLRFSVKDCKYYPELKRVDRGYLPRETVSDDILVVYSYAKSTFTLQERILIVLFMIVFGFLLAGFLLERKQGILNKTALGIFLTVILAWNYLYNSIDVGNSMFTGFQAESEILVRGVIIDEHENGRLGNAGRMGYGLGAYGDLKKIDDNFNRIYLTDDYWNNGYSRTEAAIIVISGPYTQQIAAVGNTVGFSNGEELSITEVDDDNTNIIIKFDHKGILNPLKYGDLDDAVFYDANHNRLPKGSVSAYTSQYGLQGKIFRHLTRFMNEDDMIDSLYLICSLLTAIVFVLICTILANKYNIVMAGCFYFVFWLSPWITCFARNLYWVEFTWFLPMLAGLFCAWKTEDKRCRWIAYASAYFTVLIKSLCGYEYLSTVMMGLISFLLVDAFVAAFRKDTKKLVLLIKSIMVIGILALAGFLTAIVIHARLKGDGEILFGIKQIIYSDVLRRTGGGDLNSINPVYWESLNASVWETFCKYFKFNTQIITGVPGNLFSLLCIVPVFIFISDYRKHILNAELPVMYIVFFISSISWFCLAKGHSYIHTHISFVLWYFGFVQICFYVIINKLTVLYRGK